MGTSINMARCKDCEEKDGFDKNESFGIILEWLSKENAKAEIEKTRCPKCNGENWYFTDDMGQERPNAALTGGEAVPSNGVVG